jgi:hypothetical protein
MFLRRKALGYVMIPSSVQFQEDTIYFGENSQPLV